MKKLIDVNQRAFLYPEKHAGPGEEIASGMFQVRLVERTGTTQDDRPYRLLDGDWTLRLFDGFDKAIVFRGVIVLAEGEEGGFDPEHVDEALEDIHANLDALNEIQKCVDEGLCRLDDIREQLEGLKADGS